MPPLEPPPLKPLLLEPPPLEPPPLKPPPLKPARRGIAVWNLEDHWYLSVCSHQGPKGLLPPEPITPLEPMPPEPYYRRSATIYSFNYRHPNLFARLPHCVWNHSLPSYLGPCSATTCNRPVSSRHKAISLETSPDVPSGGIQGLRYLRATMALRVSHPHPSLRILRSLQGTRPTSCLRGDRL